MLFNYCSFPKNDPSMCYNFLVSWETSNIWIWVCMLLRVKQIVWVSGALVSTMIFTKSTQWLWNMSGLFYDALEATVSCHVITSSLSHTLTKDNHCAFTLIQPLWVCNCTLRKRNCRNHSVLPVLTTDTVLLTEEFSIRCSFLWIDSNRIFKTNILNEGYGINVNKWLINWR